MNFDAPSDPNKWAVEVLAALMSIDQKLGFMLQAMENLAFPIQMMPADSLVPGGPSNITETVPESVDAPVTIKALDGSEETVLLSSIEAKNPKTARAIRIARALDEPFQAYIMNERAEVGIIVGDGTKEHIERLRSSGQWV